MVFGSAADSHRKRRKISMRLLVATNNKVKLSEILSLLEDVHLEKITPDGLGIHLDVAEIGNSYEENASLKAKAFARLSGLVTLADDSGLEVDALGGLPGIRSARFSSLPNATDADRRAYLLDLLNNIPRPWTANFHCTVAIASPGGTINFTHGSCPGE